MGNTKFCNKVITIPQYEPTCWFNAILMAILYSQNSRKLLLDDILLKKKNTKIAKVINHILKYQYVSNKYAEQYFKIMTPGKILKYLNIFDEFRKTITNNGWFSELFLPIFIEKACYNTCLNLDLYRNNIYIEFKKKIRVVDNYNNGNHIGFSFYDDNISDTDLATQILKKLNEPNPDYIFLNIGHDNSKDLFTSYLINNIQRINNILNLKNYTITSSGLKEANDEIIYNGDTYILDSCIIANYNILEINLGHAIVGITCKNEKYVYNGWIRTTKDPAMAINDNENDNDNEKLLPCELMKFDWRVNNKDSKFCINPKLCKLDILKLHNDPLEKKDLCFSFGNGKRTLIYVKKPRKDIKSIDSNIIITNPSTITLPTETTKTEDIFAYIKKNEGNKELYKNLKIKMKNIKIKKNLLAKLKELKIKKKKLETEIAELKIMIKN
jgi:hypothetical protein